MDIVELPGFPGIARGCRNERTVLVVGGEVGALQARVLAAMVCSHAQLHEFDAWLATRRRAAG